MVIYHMIEQFHSNTFNQEKTIDSQIGSRVFIAALFIIAKKYKREYKMFMNQVTGV